MTTPTNQCSHCGETDDPEIAAGWPVDDEDNRVCWRCDTAAKGPERVWLPRTALEVGFGLIITREGDLIMRQREGLTEPIRYLRTDSFDAQNRAAWAKIRGERLRGLLERVAAAYEPVGDSDLDDCQPKYVSLTLGDVRAADRMLRQLEREEGR